MFCKAYIFNVWVFMQANPGTVLSRYLGDSRTVFHHWSCPLKMVQCITFFCLEYNDTKSLFRNEVGSKAAILKVVAAFQSYMATTNGILGTYILTSLHATFQLLNTVVTSTNIQIAILNNTLTRKGSTRTVQTEQQVFFLRQLKAKALDINISSHNVNNISFDTNHQQLSDIMNGMLSWFTSETLGSS